MWIGSCNVKPNYLSLCASRSCGVREGSLSIKLSGDESATQLLKNKDRLSLTCVLAQVIAYTDRHLYNFPLKPNNLSEQSFVVGCDVSLQSCIVVLLSGGKCILVAYPISQLWVAIKNTQTLLAISSWFELRVTRTTIFNTKYI